MTTRRTVLLTLATTLIAGFGMAALAEGQVRRARIHVDGMTWAGCAAGVQRKLEEVPGVAEVTVDWKEKRAEVLASPEGYDPSLLAPAVTRAGFVAPGAEIGLEVSAIGTVKREGDELFFDLPDERWRLSGKSLEEWNHDEHSEPIILRGRLVAREEDALLTLEADSEKGD